MTRTGWILLGVGGAAAVGIAYVLTRKPTPQVAAASSPAADVPAPPPPQPAYVTPGATYGITLTGDQSIDLVAGQTVLVQLPPAPAGTVGWNPIVENHDGQVSYLQPPAEQTPNTFVIVAISPGVGVVHFAPRTQYGPGATVYSLAVSVHQVPGYVGTQSVGANGTVNLSVGQSVVLQYSGSALGHWVVDPGGGLLADSSKIISTDGGKVTGLAPGRGLLHWVNPDATTAADVSVQVS